MLIHNFQAIKRDIKFIENVHTQIDVLASDHCCWNCLWSIMTYNGLWCEKDMEDVDLRDLCISWEGERQYL
jgi:hypothetical protein